MEKLTNKEKAILQVIISDKESENLEQYEVDVLVKAVLIIDRA